MTFQEILRARNLEHILFMEEFDTPPIPRLFYTVDLIKGIVEQNRKTLLITDPDPDGLMSMLEMRDTFRYIGFTNFECYRFDTRSHTLNRNAVTYAIQEGFESVIIFDTASNDLGLLDILDAHNIQTIVIDHHMTKNRYHNYPLNCNVFNSQVENTLRDANLWCSAGGLTYLICNEFLQQKGVKRNNLSAYALVTLYSDVMPMNNSINRAIYMSAVGMDETTLPPCIRTFLNDYTVFSRRFIIFRFTNKINSLFRAERFDLINRYFLDEEFKESFTILNQIEEVYNESRALITRVTDLIRPRVMNNFVITNLNALSDFIDVQYSKLYNYTGLIANELSNRYGKPAIVLCNYSLHIKGSFRDTLSRDFLGTFQTFSNSNGHRSAFGIHIPKNELSQFTSYLEILDRKSLNVTGGSKPLIIKSSLLTREDIFDMAFYNEFSGNDLPVALLELPSEAVFTPKYNKYYKMYEWEGYCIKSSKEIRYRNRVLVKPEMGARITLYFYDDLR